MSIYLVAVLICWMVFILVWAFASLAAKPSVGRGMTALMIFRILIAAAVIIFVRDVIAANVAHPLLSVNPLAGILAVFLTALGIGFAIWARFSIGRNWGMPMTRRVEPELVTAGPYAYVRHPIYTGSLLALLGTALLAGPVWLIAFVFAAAYFLVSARREEQFLIQRFPEQYPEYRKRTKLLIPFVW